MTMEKARRTVLIVGDPSQKQKIYRQCLEEDTNYTYTIREEKSDERGLELCRQLQPDAVLLDLSSSVTGILKFLAEIQSQKIISAVIVFTEQQDESIATQVMENGAQNCLVTKEVRPQSLRFAVRSAIETTNLRRSLQQSSERLNIVLEVAQICSWEWNIVSDKVWLSQNFASLFGMESGRFANLSHTWLEIVHPEDREFVRNTIAQISKKKGDYFQEYRLLLDGKISWVRCQGKFFCDQIGDPVRMVGTIQDITISKQSEEQLQESQDFIHQIADTTPGILYVYDLNTQRNIYVNKQAEQVLGYTDKCVEMMGADFTKQVMHPEDYLRLASHTEQFNRAHPGEMFTFEYRMRHANGEWRWFTSRDKVFKYTQDGRPLQIIGSAQDITERKNIEEALKRSHEQFQLATTAVNSFVYDWDIPRNYVESSQGLFKVLGYTESEVVPTPQWLETIIHGSDRLRVEKEFQAALANGDRYSIEYRLSYKNEPRYLWVRDTGFPVRDGNGCVTRIAGIMIDISESKQSQAKLQETLEQVNLATTAAQLGMWFWNIATDELIWTEKCKALFGLSPDTKISYEVFLNSLHPEDRHHTHEAVSLTLAENVEYNVEYRTVWPDGSIHWISAKGRSFYDSDGKAVRMMGTAQDISKRKQIEESLAINQERLELAQKAGQIGVFDWDIQTGTIAWSEQEEIIFGLPPGSFGGRIENWGERVYPDDLLQTDQSLQQTIENQIQNWQGEFRIIHQGTGEIRWIDARGRFFYDEFGKPLRMIGTNIDITERKQSQEALRQSEMRFRRLVESNIIGCIVSDMVGNITEANDAFLTMVSYTREDLRSGNLRWLDMTPSEYAYLDRKAIAEAREFGACIPFEKEYIRKDGSRVPILIGFALLEGDEDNAICFIVDQTERKITEEALRQSQAHLNSFVEANVIGILFGDVDGGISKANDEFLRIIGYQRQDLQTGKIRWSDITPPEYLPLDAKGIAEAQIIGACTPYEKEYIRKDGSRVPVLVGYALVGEQRRESVAFILDLTASKQMEAALRENEERSRHLAGKEQAARAEAEAANRAKDNFVAMVSHDLRAPLNSILGWAKLLRSGKVDPDNTAKALETIERNAKSQARLIEDLLDISCMIEGRLNLVMTPVNLATVIQISIEQVGLLALEKQIQIESRIDTLSVMVPGDFHRLQQIMANLLSNAIKFTSLGGRVEVCLESIGSQQVQIRVIDNGKGISPEFLPHVFDRFRQQEPSPSRTNSGLGLGLAIVSHLVKLHQGTVRAESQGEGQGAMFIIELPLIVNG